MLFCVVKIKWAHERGHGVLFLEIMVTGKEYLYLRLTNWTAYNTLGPLRHVQALDKTAKSEKGNGFLGFVSALFLSSSGAIIIYAILIF